MIGKIERGQETQEWTFELNECQRVLTEWGSISYPVTRWGELTPTRLKIAKALSSLSNAEKGSESISLICRNLRGMMEDLWVEAEDISSHVELTARTHTYDLVLDLEAHLIDGSCDLFRKRHPSSVPTSEKIEEKLDQSQLNELIEQTRRTLNSLSEKPRCFFWFSENVKSIASLLQKHIEEAGIVWKDPTDPIMLSQNRVETLTEELGNCHLAIIVGTREGRLKFEKDDLRYHLYDRIPDGVHRLLLEGSPVESFTSPLSSRSAPHFSDCRDPSNYLPALNAIIKHLLSRLALTATQPAPETQPIPTIHPVDRIRLAYRGLSLANRRIAPEAPLKEVFVKPRFVESQTQRGYEWELSSYEEIYAISEELNLNEITQNSKGVRLAIIGRAGGGKSELLHWIAYQWSALTKEQFTTEVGPWVNGCEAVIWFRLRDLFQPHLETIFTDWSTTHDEKLARLFEQLTLNGNITPGLVDLMKRDTTLFLLDGLDEVDLSGAKSQIIRHLLGKNRLVITSRLRIEIPRDCQLVEIVGLSIAAAEEYAEKFFTSIEQPEKAESFKAFLRKRQAFDTMRIVPLTAEALCYRWLVSQEISPNFTLTSLMKDVYVDFYKKSNDITNQAIDYEDILSVDPTFSILDETAFTLLKQHQKIFFGKEVFGSIFLGWIKEPTKRTELYYRLLRKNVMLKETGISHPSPWECHYYFQHLIIQEFCAARFLSRAFIDGHPTRLSKESAELFIIEQKYNPKFQMLFCFTAGLLSENGCDADRFLSLLLENDKSWTGFGETALAARCLDETSDDLIKSSTDIFTNLRRFLESPFLNKNGSKIYSLFYSINLLAKRGDEIIQLKNQILQLADSEEGLTELQATFLAVLLGLKEKDIEVQGVNLKTYFSFKEFLKVRATNLLENLFSSWRGQNRPISVITENDFTGQFDAKFRDKFEKMARKCAVFKNALLESWKEKGQPGTEIITDLLETFYSNFEKLIHDYESLNPTLLSDSKRLQKRTEYMDIETPWSRALNNLGDISPELLTSDNSKGFNALYRYFETSQVAWIN